MIYLVGKSGVKVEVPTLEEAITGPSYAGCEIYITSTYSGTSISFPKDRKVVMSFDGKLNYSDSITFLGDFEADLSEHFTGNAYVNFYKIDKVFPQWWGAVGDGIVDDTVAIDKASASLSSGVLFFVAGTYLISPVVYGTYCLLQRTKQIWRGEGRLASTLLLGSSSGPITSVIRTASGAEHYALEDIGVDGNRDNITPSGVDLYNTYNLVVGPEGGAHGGYRRVLLKNSWGRTLQTGYESGAERTINVVVDDVVVLNSGTKAISGTKTDGLTIQNCYAEVYPYSDSENPLGVGADSGSCFELNNCSDALISSCRGTQIGIIKAPGIRIINGSHDAKVSQCAIEHASYLGFIQNSDDVEFSHSVGRDIRTIGFLITDSDASQPTNTCKRVYVHHNKIDGTGGSFVLISAEKAAYNAYVETYIHDNIFIGDAEYGIYNKGVTAPAIGGLCEVFQWSNTFDGTIVNGDLSGAGESEIQPRPDSGWRVVQQSSVPAILTGTTAETTLVSVGISPDMLGKNGRLKITFLYSYTNSSNNKIARVRFGGIQAHAATLTTTAQTRTQIEVCNRNSLSNQVVCVPGASSGFGSTTSGLLELSINTNLNTSISITGQLALASETLTLESYLVEVFHQ